MNMRQLEVFRAVIASGGISNAAANLGVSQPAVSRMIKNTERTLGFPLFQRRGGRVVPTDEAQRLYAEIDPLFASMRTIQERIHDIRDSKAGMLRIVATPGLAHSIVPQALKPFLSTRPEVQVSLDIRRWENVLQHIQTNTSDVGLALTPGNLPGMVLQPIQMGAMVCILPVAHPLAELEIVTPKDLIHYPFIMMTRGSPLGRLITQSFQDADIPLDWSIETPYSASAATLVKMGFGVALVDEYVAYQNDLQGIVVKPYRPEILITAYLLYSDLRPLSIIAKSFIQVLLNTRSES